MTHPSLEIRHATPEEIAQIAAIVNAAYTKWIDVIGGKPMPMTADYHALIAQQRVYSVRDGLELIAVLVIWQADDALYVDNLAVDPAHQGRGVGSQLLTFAERKAREMQLSKLTLCTNEKMTYNQAHYAKHGYFEIRRETTPNGRRAVWMQKQL